MIAILDTNAAVSFVMKQPHAESIADAVEQADLLIVPMLFVSEAANVFWKLHAFNAMPVEECECLLEQTISLPDEFTDDRELFREAFLLSRLHQKPIYDMMYLALAQRNDGLLITADKVLRRIANKQSVRVQ